MTLRLGSRGSDLAMTQARMVADALTADDPDLDVEIVEVQTTGDIDTRRFDVIEGRGIFVRELDIQVTDEEIDAAVHSLKDVPTDLIEGVDLQAHLAPASRGDALVSRHGDLDDLPGGATVGTSSPRRKAQLRRARDDLEVVDLRGNVPTRVEKARTELDGAVLARAGLERLDIEGWSPLPFEGFAPAPGQGIVCATARPGSDAARRLARVDDADASLISQVERTIIGTLGVGCHTPLGVETRVDDDVEVRAELLAVDGSETVQRTTRAPRSGAVEAARDLAEDLRDEAAHLL